MKLTPEEYNCGLASWIVDSPAILQINTAIERETPNPWCPLLVDPSGSVVPFAINSFTFSFLLKDRLAASRPWEIRWERIWEDRLITHVWNNAHSDKPLLLEHVPNFGIFHRLVVRTPFLELATGSVLRVGDLLVRFFIGPVDGDKAEPFESVEYEPSRVIVTTGRIGTFREEGRFIEIVAPGATSDQAELNAYSTLGVIAAAVGPNAVGEVVFSERHQNLRDDGHGGMSTSALGRNPWFVSDDVIALIHDALPVLNGEGRMAKAVALGLRWYERGQRGDTEIDRLLAYFVGIEAVTTAYSIEHGPLPEAQQRQEQYEKLRLDLEEVVSGDEVLLKRLRDRLVEPSLTDRVRFYVRQQGWDETAVDEFSQLARARNKIFHGSSLTVDAAIARMAERLLGRVIRRELHLPESMEWEDRPLVFPVQSETR